MNTTQAILRLRQVIRRQHKALATEENYVFWLRRYMVSVRQMPGTLSSEKKLERDRVNTVSIAFRLIPRSPQKD